MFTRDQFAKEGDDAGVFLDGLGNALVTFCAMQDHTVTVSEAAKAFNTTTDVIREAGYGSPWISIEGQHDEADNQRLELDGE